MVVLRVIAAYKTVAQDAAAIISRIPPYYLTAEARKRAYERIRDLKIAREWTKKEEKVIIREEVGNSFNKWKEYLLTRSAAGVRTREAILPVWDEWMFRRHGNVGFHITQMFTGHGVFYSYLRRIGRVTTDRCPHCATGEVDTVDHTLIVCNAWMEEREDMLRRLCITADSLSLRSLVSAMVDSKEGWITAQTFIGKVMLAKEDKERQIEKESHAVSTSGDDSD
ncbi:Reverse transcriptase [Camponotus japonicus]